MRLAILLSAVNLGRVSSNEDFGTVRSLVEVIIIFAVLIEVYHARFCNHSPVTL